MSRRSQLVLGWLLTLAVIAGFARLGVWQSQRAVEKQAMLDDAAQVLASRQPVGLDAAADPGSQDRYQWARGSGEFAPGPQWLLDNQQRDGRVGVQAYRIFVPGQGQPLLVDLGWLPLPGDRAMPSVERPEGHIEVQGLLAPPPSGGIALGAGMAQQAEGWLMLRLDIPAISAPAGTPLAPRVLRLDPASPLGYERDLALLPNTLPPAKHRGYALQWFGLALAVLVTALILTFRKPRRRKRPPTMDKY
ncbi:SURF1 family protein [Lysobacter sp. H23M47]|uniref:SURF1 family protein n=1 Tax=Lysobacter sp. H23M47 TaxID=2781024 RepID=UPI001880016D|nr:SURF1 family protein [Lysobacter sp. H23M47]QOW24280.1 SURF1 family protein [Lysobacter sp. H23M47]